MRRYLRIEPYIRRIAQLFGYQFVKIQTGPQFEHLLSYAEFLELYFSMIDTKDFFYLQIGANDGVSNDYIYPFVTKYKLRGIAVEPQPDVFPRLQETYKAYDRVRCVNVAIATSAGNLPFYSAKEQLKTPENFKRVTGLATFNKEVIQKTIKRKIPRGANPDDYIQETLVKAITFSDLVAQQQIQKIDMLQIDCEGYDYEIIKMIDLKRFRPKIINFESGHLSESDREECQKLLERHGYTWFRHSIDTCAFLVEDK